MAQGQEIPGAPPTTADERAPGLVGHFPRWEEGPHPLAPVAVLGRSFTLEELAALAGTTIGEALDVVGAAVAEGLLDASGSRLFFASEEARHRVVDTLGRAQPLPERPPDLATPTSLEWLRSTAARVAGGVPAVAVELLQSALPLARGADRSELMVELALSLFAAGRYEEAEDVTRRVLPSASAEHEFVLRDTLVQSLLSRGLLERAAREAEEAAARNLGGGRARFVAATAMAPLYSWDLDAAEAAASVAESEAIAESDGAALAAARRVQVQVALFRGRLTDAERLTNAMVATAGVVGDEGADPIGVFVAALVQLDLDRPVEAMHLLNRGARIVAALGLKANVQVARAFVGAVQFQIGRWEDAAVELAGAAQAGEGGWHSDSVALLAILHALRGHHREAEVWALRAESGSRSGDPMFVPGRIEWMRGLVAGAAGDRISAAAYLAEAWRVTEVTGVVRERRKIGPALLRAAPAGAGTVSAAEVIEGLAELSARNPHVPGLAGALGWAEGLAAGDGGRLLEALELIRETGRPLDIALCCFDAGRLLAGESAAAVPLLQEAAAEFERLGVAGERRKALAALRGAGGVPASRPAASHAVGWPALTGTERRVAALVAAGLSNRQIGERMFISPRTASTHVSNILAKLGVHTRTEIAVLAYKELGEEEEERPESSV